MFYKKVESEDGSTVYHSVSDDVAEMLEGIGEDIVDEKEFKRLARERLESSDRECSEKERFLRMLPFLDREDISELVDGIIAGECELPVSETAIYPFAGDSDLDRLFLHKLSKGDKKIAALAPFVPNETLSKGVDMVLEGKYKLSLFDSLYPFLARKDIKRLFSYAMSKRKGQNEAVTSK